MAITHSGLIDCPVAGLRDRSGMVPELLGTGL